MSRRVTALVAFLLVSALASSTLANCTAVLEMASQAQMACCRDGHDTCPMHGSGTEAAADCCRNDSQRQQQISAAEHQWPGPTTTSLERGAVLDHQRSVPFDVNPAVVAVPVAALCALSTPAHLLTTALLI